MHIGKNNPEFEYFMEGKKLNSAESKKDIDVRLNKKTKAKPTLFKNFQNS